MNKYWIWKDEWMLNMKGWMNIKYEKKMNIEYVRKYEWINEYWILNINE